MYLEASAMLPQIYMFQKQAATEGGIVEVNIRVFVIIEQKSGVERTAILVASWHDCSYHFVSTGVFVFSNISSDFVFVLFCC